MIGVNGWCSANQRRPAGIESVGTKPLPRNGRSIRNIGRLLAVSTVLATRPRPTESHVSASVRKTTRPAAASQSSAEACRAEADRDRNGEHEQHGEQRLDHVGDHVAGEHRAAPDGHRLEAGDDALGHVDGDADRGQLSAAHDGEEQDAGREVVGVGTAVAAADAGQPGAERPAEDVDEQQQEDERDPGDEQGQAGVATHAPEVAAQHRGGVGEGVGSWSFR